VPVVLQLLWEEVSGCRWWVSQPQQAREVGLVQKEARQAKGSSSNWV